MESAIFSCPNNARSFELAGPVILILLILLVVIYVVDINYYLRAIIIFFRAFFIKKKLGILESSEVYGIVLPSDSDLQITHMNNARVLREYDFGRMDFWARTGLLDKWIADTLSLKRSQVLAVSNVLRYRRPLHMFMKYKTVTKAVYWDGKILYLEQRMVTLNDEMTRNIGYLKVIFPYDIDEFVKKKHPGILRPELPHDLEIWMKFNEANSQRSAKSRRKVKQNANISSDEWCSN